MQTHFGFWNSQPPIFLSSFADVSNDSLFQDIDLLVVGVVIMVFYVQLVISKYNFLEARVSVPTFKNV